jgi:hypothetical protein
LISSWLLSNTLISNTSTKLSFDIARNWELPINMHLAA